MLLNSISVGILCGGRGSRMSGKDKGLIEIDGRTLVNQVIDKVPQEVHEILINANRNIDIYKTLGRRVIEDGIDGYQGPLAGMEALLGAIETDWLMTLPCDTPNFPTDIITRLQLAADDNVLIRCPHDGVYRQSVFALMNRRVLPAMRDFLNRGERKIDRFFAEVGFIDVDFSDDKTRFNNLNRPEDLADLSEN